MNKIRLLSIGLSIPAVAIVFQFAAHQNASQNGIEAATVPAPEGPSAIIRSLRPAYPYSVISGGVYTPTELALAHRRDSVVQAHYAGFDVAHARLVRLTDDRFQYASYRVNDHIFWTRNKLRIPKGELLLTDGVNYARARCGNRLSDTPRSEVNPHEPDKAILSMPDITPEARSNLALANPAVPPEDRNLSGPSDSAPAPSGEEVTPMRAPATPGTPQPLTPTDPMITGFSGSPVISSGPVIMGGPISSTSTSSPPTSGQTNVTATPQPTPVNPVPEPGTIGLFLLSFVVSVFALLRMTPKDESN